MSPRRLFRAIFVDQLRLRRAGSQVVITLEPAAVAAVAPPRAFAAKAPPASAPLSSAPPSSAPLSPPASASASSSPPASAERMHAALRRLLDGRRDSREVLRHLAALERRLEQGDASFMHSLSVASLQSMLRQLQGLVAPPPPTDIALLQAELQTALDERHRAAAEETLRPIVTSLLVDQQPEVTELDPATLDMEFDDTPRAPSFANTATPTPATAAATATT